MSARLFHAGRGGDGLAEVADFASGGEGLAGGGLGQGLGGRSGGRRLVLGSAGGMRGAGAQQRRWQQR